jgi:unsaturated chondroitin disaccharide hydrolase
MFSSPVSRCFHPVLSFACLLAAAWLLQPTAATAQLPEPMQSAVAFADAQMRATLADLGYAADGVNPDWSTHPNVFPKVTSSASGLTLWDYGNASGNWGAGFTPGLMWDLYELTGDAYWRGKAVSFTDGVERTKTAGGDMRMNIGFHMMNSFARRIAWDNPAGDYAVVDTAAGTLLGSWMSEVGSLWSFSWGRGFRADGLWGGWNAYQNTIIDSAPNLEVLFYQAKLAGDVGMWDKAVSHLDNLVRDLIRPDGGTAQLAAYNPATGEFLGPRGHQGYSFASTWSRGQGWALHGFASAWRETRDALVGAAFHDLYSYYRDNCPADGIPYWDFNAPELTDADLEIRYRAKDGDGQDIPDPRALENRWGRDTSAAALAASALLQAVRLTDDPALQAEYFHYAERILVSLSTPGYLACDAGYNPTKQSILDQGAYTFPGINTGQIWGDFFFVEALRRYRELIDPATEFDAASDQGDLTDLLLWQPMRWSAAPDCGTAALRLQGGVPATGDLPADAALYRHASYGDFDARLRVRADALAGAGEPLECVFIFGYENRGSFLFVRVSDTPGRTGVFRVVNGTSLALGGGLSDWVPSPDPASPWSEMEVQRTGDRLQVFADAVPLVDLNHAAIAAPGHAGVGGAGQTLLFDALAITGDATTAELSPRSAWRQSHFTRPAGIRAMDFMDPDRDGRPNLLEYAFGGNPQAADPGQPGLRIGPDGLGGIELAFPFNNQAGDIVYRLLYSADGAAWSPVLVNQPTGVGGWNTLTFAPSITGPGARLYRIEIDAAD